MGGVGRETLRTMFPLILSLPFINSYAPEDLKCDVNR